MWPGCHAWWCPDISYTVNYGGSIPNAPDNRLKEITGMSDYSYNGLGERVLKATSYGGATAYYNSQKTIYVYGQDGLLLAEYGPTGQVRKQYIYVNGELLAMLTYTADGNEPILNADIDNDGAIGQEDQFVWYFEHYLPASARGDVNADNRIDQADLDAVTQCAQTDHCVTASYARNIYYAYTDHLGTPRALTNETGALVWYARYAPFGLATVNEDVDGDGNTVTLNIRFPGQYYDKESGFHYNYYRTYDPQMGRYLTSDPIGLLGGVNTFGYVGGNPLIKTDPYGLFGIAGSIIGGTSAFVGTIATGGSVQEAILNGTIGALFGFVPGGTTLVGSIIQGGLIGGISNSISQITTIANSPCKNLDDFNAVSVFGSVFGGALIAGRSQPFGYSVAVQFNLAPTNFLINTGISGVASNLGGEIE